MSLNFGNPLSAPATTATLGGGFSFGANKPTFGLGSSAPGGGFAFGSPAATSAPTFAAPSTGFSTPATAATGLGFAPLTTTTASASTRFGLDNLTSAASTGLTFGGANTNAHNTSGGFTINSAIGTSGAQSFGLGPPPTSAAPLFGLKTITTTATAQPSLTGAPPVVGLGGVEASGGSTLPGIGASPWSAGEVGNTGGTAGTGANEQPRHQKLSNELLQTVDAFKGFVKQQKSLSSDVARASIKPLQKVSTTLDALSTSILTATVNVRTSRTSARRLRESSARALATAEEAGTGGLFSSGAPELLIALVADHEAVVRRFAMQVDAAVRQMHGGTRTLTEQDLTMGMRRMHEMLIALAGRLAALGTQVNELKQFYLNLRRHRLNLTDDVFHQQDQNTLRDTTMLTNVLNQLDDRKQYLNTTNIGGSSYQANSVVIADPRLALANPNASIVGPTPFTYLGPPGFGGYPFGYSSPSRENNPQMSAATQGGFGSPWNIPQQNTLSFPGSAVSPLSNPLPTDNSSSFLLQKPPTGYKRGKH